MWTSARWTTWAHSKPPTRRSAGHNPRPPPSGDRGRVPSGRERGKTRSNPLPLDPNPEDLKRIFSIERRDPPDRLDGPSTGRREARNCVRYESLRLRPSSDKALSPSTFRTPRCATISSRITIANLGMLSSSPTSPSTAPLPGPLCWGGYEDDEDCQLDRRLPGGEEKSLRSRFLRS